MGNPTLGHDKLHGLYLFLPGILAFIVYWLTMPYTLQVGDAGEQITAAHFLGISHPTGSPLYLLLMKCWEVLFPFGTIVFRMNLLNTILGSISVILFGRLIYWICIFHHLPPSRGLFSALIAALTLAFSKTFWYESVAASSYILHCLFVVVWLTVTTKIILQKNYKNLYILYLLSGISLANHVLSLILIFLTWFYSVSLWVRKKISIKTVCGLPFLIVPGVLFYLYIPLRSVAHPLLNWDNPSSFGRFIDYILRKDYYRNIYVSTLTDFLEIIGFHLKSFLWEMSPVLPGLVLASILCLILQYPYLFRNSNSRLEEFKHTFRSSSQLIILGIILMALNLFAVSMHGSHIDIFYWKRYILMGYISLFFSSIIFFLLALTFFTKRLYSFLMGFLILMPLICLISHFEANDRSKNTLVKSYLDQLFSHLPHGATFYAIGDNHLFPVLYYHFVEGYRPDLVLFNPKVGMGDKAMVPSLSKSGLFYSSHYFKTKEPLKVIPMGLVFKITEEIEPVKKEIKWGEFTQNDILKARSPFEKVLLAVYYRRRAVYHEQRNEQQQRLHWIRKMESVAGGFDRTLMLTGREFGRIGMVSKAIQYFEKALTVNPKNRAAKFYLEKYDVENSTLKN